jgi:hypothetical protein
MKHLKKYNIFESKKSKSLVKEIKDFCKVNLAYLIDDGINIEVESDEDDDDFIIITLENNYDDFIKWEEIKNDFLPFLELINDKYKLTTDNKNSSKLVRFTTSASWPTHDYKYFTIDKIMRDDFNIKNIEYIQLFVKNI